MALVPDVASSTDPVLVEEHGTPIDAPGLNYFVFGLFFIFGGITDGGRNSQRNPGCPSGSGR